MDLNVAIQFGQLSHYTYAAVPTDLTNRAGKTQNAGLIGGGINYQVIATLYANDLATDMNPLRSNDIVSIGLSCKRLELATRSSPFAVPKAFKSGSKTPSSLLCRALSFWAPGKRKTALPPCTDQ